MVEKPIVIVGAGLAGLSCALGLQRAGLPFLLLEGSDRVGGRVRTEIVDGFQLDVGFQVLLTSYPELSNSLDLLSLKLGKFEAGALIRHQGKFVRLSDPWREPKYLWRTAFANVATFLDKWRVLRLRWDVSRGGLDELLERPETTSWERLVEFGLSPRILEGFFAPFWGGVFLDDELNTSSRKLDYLFRLFSLGSAALPAEGMGQLPAEMVRQLPAAAVRLHSRVVAVSKDHVELVSGERIPAAHVVVACDPWNAAKLVAGSIPPRARGTQTIYFAATKPPLVEPVLVLNGEGGGVVRSLCVPSQVCPRYAPAGQSLISLTVFQESQTDDSQRLIQESLNQMVEWFGESVRSWRHLRTYQIPQALPAQDQMELPMNRPRFARTAEGILVCGDAHDVASIQGAMRSGREVAEYLASQVR
ncbi:MAG: FAD-dependent oxidoreductase [Planctomycetaceae bacterium]|nr:FAD-dependent oxidoreductase [Planctomycetaceae bacterium]